MVKNGNTVNNKMTLILDYSNNANVITEDFKSGRQTLKSQEIENEM